MNPTDKDTGHIPKRVETVIPEALQPHVRSIGELQRGDTTYTYAVYDPAFARQYKAPDLSSMFSNGILAISEAFPEEYRELGLMHEIAEYTELKPHGDDACVESTVQELKLAEEKGLDMKAYIAFRIGFFEQMIPYVESLPKSEQNDATLRGMRKSYSYLKGL